MLELLMMVVLCIRIKKIVEPKGYNTTNWVLRMVVLWICADAAGISLSLYLGKDLYICMISGLLCGLCSYLYLQNKARNLPNLNKTKDWRDFFNKD